MLGENIKRLRKTKGLSQEELAVQLNVVRQTVSKWENGLSVPDADLLVRLAELLGVPVGQLLGAAVREDEAEDLAEELSRLNAELAANARREGLNAQANQKRGLILALTFACALVALSVKNEIASILLCATCVLAALVILYRNLALLTAVTTESAKLRPLRVTTIFDIAMIAIVMAVIFLDKAALISLTEEGEKALAMGCITFFMLFAGYISPKLPFTRHTGLRLPWTVQDEDAWNVAHRILGHISLPTALLYLAAACTVADFGTVTLIALLLWLGIPAVLSLIFLWKKLHGK